MTGQTKITVNGIVWEQREAGRWCSELGKVVWEPCRKLWWWESPEGEDGPYKSMRVAMEAAGEKP